MYNYTSILYVLLDGLWGEESGDRSPLISEHTLQLPRPQALPRAHI